MSHELKSRGLAGRPGRRYECVNLFTCSLVHVEIRKIGRHKKGENGMISWKFFPQKSRRLPWTPKARKTQNKDNGFVQECKVTVAEKVYDIHVSFQYEIERNDDISQKVNYKEPDNIEKHIARME